MIDDEALERALFAARAAEPAVADPPLAFDDVLRRVDARARRAARRPRLRAARTLGLAAALVAASFAVARALPHAGPSGETCSITHHASASSPHDPAGGDDANGDQCGAAMTPVASDATPAMAERATEAAPTDVPPSEAPAWSAREILASYATGEAAMAPTASEMDLRATATRDAIDTAPELASYGELRDEASLGICGAEVTCGGDRP